MDSPFFLSVMSVLHHAGIVSAAALEKQRQIFLAQLPKTEWLMATLASVISMEMYSGRDPFTRQEEWHCQKVWVLVIQSVQECHTWAKELGSMVLIVSGLFV